jgi:hypothetical protein
MPAAERPARWSSWVESRRATVAGRVAQGEDDSLVNLLLFGTSFTREPRVTPAFLASLEREWQGEGGSHAQDTLLRVYTRRASDLVAALARPHDDERLRLARATLERRGLRVTMTADASACRGGAARRRRAGERGRSGHRAGARASLATGRSRRGAGRALARVPRPRPRAGHHRSHAVRRRPRDRRAAQGRDPRGRQRVGASPSSAPVSTSWTNRRATTSTRRRASSPSPSSTAWPAPVSARSTPCR